MLQQIHKQNQLRLHLEHGIELEVYQIQHVDPMPNYYNEVIFILFFSQINLLE
jgi:hypothetical protein